MLLLDAFFRFSGIGFLALIFVLTVRDNRESRSSPYLLLACLSVSSLFLGYTITELTPPSILYYPARILDVAHLILVWLFALSLYQKDFRLKPVHWAIGLVYVAPILWIRLSGFGVAAGPPSWLIPYVSITSLILVGHLIFATLGEWRDDLLTLRRRSRLYFVLMIVFVTIVAAMSEPFLTGGGSVQKQTFKIMSIWPAIVLGAVWLLQANRSPVLFTETLRAQETLSKPDEALKMKLDTAMVRDEIYKDFDLNIVKLAAHLGVTQHRLRALINQSLGHQNFSSYINEFRISEIKKALGDKNKQHIPIQTLALDCGFKSLSPFNRAFRSIEGMTPSDYRSKHLNSS